MRAQKSKGLPRGWVRVAKEGPSEHHSSLVRTLTTRVDP